MLVVTRRINEKVQIGPDVTITITKIGKNDVRIGIDAPKEMEISRPDDK